MILRVGTICSKSLCALSCEELVTDKLKLKWVYDRAMRISWGPDNVQKKTKKKQQKPKKKH